MKIVIVILTIILLSIPTQAVAVEEDIKEKVYGFSKYKEEKTKRYKTKAEFENRIRHRYNKQVYNHQQSTLKQ